MGFVSGPRVNFVGILYAVHQFTSDGKVEVTTIPTAFDLRVKTQLPANLGLVIKSSRMRDFKSVLERIQNRQEELERENANRKKSSSK